jgi:nucleotide-binding universal stress UspA family protein
LVVDKITNTPQGGAEEIAKYAEQEAIDLILMGPHGYKGFNELILGSEAHKVPRNAPCLVMTEFHLEI